MAEPSKPFIDLYWESVRDRIGATGIELIPLLARHHDGTVTMAVLDLEPKKIFDAAYKLLADLTVKELIFGIDSFTKPGQGTKYEDVYLVYWWLGKRDNAGWRFGVIDYVPGDSPVIEPINWNNTFWIKTMQGQIVARANQMTATIERWRAAGLGPLIDKVFDVKSTEKQHMIREDEC